MKYLIFVLPFLSSIGYSQIIQTIAGNGIAGYIGDGGPANAAEFNWPNTIRFDHGNMYIPDWRNNVIRKINSAGIITTVAGNGYGAGMIGVGGYTGDGGQATAAELNGPADVGFDNAGNMYFDDQGTVIRKVSTTGIITTIAGNNTSGYNGDNIAATNAQLYGPLGVVFDGAGNLYFSDEANQRVRKINTSGIITTIAGNGTAGNSGDGGPATAAQLNFPCWLAFSPTGDLYIPDKANHTVRKVNSAGIISIVAGNGSSTDSGDNGPATAAGIGSPVAILFDAAGNYYISIDEHCTIRKVSTTGIITTVAGDDNCGYSGDNGPATNAELNVEALCTAIDASGNLYIADYENSRIRRINYNTTAVNNTTPQSITLYPNPAKTILTLTTPQALPAATVTICNVLGEPVVNQAYTNLLQTDIPVSALPAGLYFVKVNGVYAGRFVKE